MASAPLNRRHAARFAAPLGMLFCLALAACGESRILDQDAYHDPGRKMASGTLLGDSPMFNFGSKAKTEDGSGTGGAGLGVNAYLWRGTLDTLSFMPLASADPFGGVVITDWYQPATATGERFKATAYILGRQLRADGVKVSVFRQVSQGGQWVDAPVNPSVATELENKVLERARELRGQGGQ